MQATCGRRGGDRESCGCPKACIFLVPLLQYVLQTSIGVMHKYNFFVGFQLVPFVPQNIYRHGCQLIHRSCVQGCLHDPHISPLKNH